MKFLILYTFLFSCNFAQAQTSKRFKETISKYFTSLPVNKNILNWIAGLQNSSSLVVDSTALNQLPPYILFTAKLKEQIQPLPHYDSARIMIGEVKSFYVHSVNGRVTNETTDIDFYVDQTFYFSQDKITHADWENLCKAIIKEFKKSTLTVYPSTTKNDPYNNVWFQTSTMERPVLMMRYGKMKDKSSYLLSLHLIIQ
jgi:hypothetical protein